MEDWLHYMFKISASTQNCKSTNLVLLLKAFGFKQVKRGIKTVSLLLSASSYSQEEKNGLCFPNTNCRSFKET